MADYIHAPPRFRNRVAVVTGAGGGIGKETARRLAAEGAHVLLVDVDRQQVANALEVVRDTAGHGGGAEDVVLDVANEDAWTTLAARIARDHGQLDLLHSNAATSVIAPAARLATKDWDRQVAVNLTATFLGFRELSGLLTQSRGAVVVTSSVHAMRGLPGRSAYAASKGGLISLTRQLAVDYGPEIRVNSVVPGPIMSGAWDDVPDADRERTVAQTVLERFGTPEEVAAAVTFLGSSSEASYITGASLVVDGGWSITADSA